MATAKNPHIMRKMQDGKFRYYPKNHLSAKLGMKQQIPEKKTVTVPAPKIDTYALPETDIVAKAKEFFWEKHSDSLHEFVEWLNK